MRVSKHAQARLRERGGLRRSAASRLASRALEHGITAAETVGQLRRYLDGIFLRHHNATARVYGEFVYLFGAQDVLVTAFQLPRPLRAAARKAFRRRSIDA